MEDVIITRNSESNIPELMETTIQNDNLQITLQVIPGTNYPDVSPLFKLLRPRGLDDQRLDDIKKACIDKLEESVGFPVVFDLIEVIREQMTQSNLPSGQCVVCLYGFEEGDEFTKTSCFHYLHSYCLARHLAASKKNFDEEQEKLPSWLRKTSSPYQPNCPVCRDPIEDCSESLKNSEPPAELNNAPAFRLSDDLRQLQLKMASLFLIQKSKGAIIDVDAENTGNLISIQTEEEARLEMERKKAAAEANLTNGQHYENGLEEEANDESENGEEEEGEDDCANYSVSFLFSLFLF
ncbi:RNF25 family protein [Megaselia abdita]